MTDSIEITEDSSVELPSRKVPRHELVNYAIHELWMHHAPSTKFDVIHNAPAETLAAFLEVNHQITDAMDADGNVEIYDHEPRTVAVRLLTDAGFSLREGRHDPFDGLSTRKSFLISRAKDLARFEYGQDHEPAKQTLSRILEHVLALPELDGYGSIAIPDHHEDEVAWAHALLNEHGLDVALHHHACVTCGAIHRGKAPTSFRCKDKACDGKVAA